jgi:hypothetical protein
MLEQIRGSVYKIEKNGLRTFGASWEVFPLKNNNLVRKTMGSVRNSVNACFRNNSPSLKQRVFAGAHFGRVYQKKI